MSLEDLFELMNAFTGKNQLLKEDKKAEMANFAARQNIISEKNHSNGKVRNHRKRDHTKKALTRDKKNTGESVFMSV